MTSGLHATTGKWSGILLLSPSPPHLLESLFPADWLFSHALSSWQDGEPNLPRVYKFYFLEISPSPSSALWPQVCDKHFSVRYEDAPEMTATGGFRNLPKLPGHQCRINSLFLNIRFSWKQFLMQNFNCMKTIKIWTCQLWEKHTLE